MRPGQRLGCVRSRLLKLSAATPLRSPSTSAGIQDPNTELLREMATLYGVSVDSLLGRDAILGEPDDDPGQSSIEADRELVMNEASLALRSTGKELSDEAIRSIADFIRFVHEKERRESESGS